MIEVLLNRISSAARKLDSLWFGLSGVAGVKATMVGDWAIRKLRTSIFPQNGTAPRPRGLIAAVCEPHGEGSRS
jgi:hypothetical protein